jgi:hypothetical protein
MSATMIMNWFTPLGTPEWYIDDNYNNVQIPAEACGFRLEIPDDDWNEAWHFGVPYSLGQILEDGPYIFSNEEPAIGPVPYIEATGPVGACLHEQTPWTFVTPMNSFYDSHWIAEHAGSFVADFPNESSVTWLGASGEEIPHHQEDHEEPHAEFPAEFFECFHVEGCVRGFDGELYCEGHDEPTCGTNGGGGHRNLRTQTRKADTTHQDQVQSLRSQNAVEPLLVAEPVIKHGFLETSTKDTTVSRQSGAVEVDCPTSFEVSVVLSKIPEAFPVNVRYYLQFTNGKRTKSFETVVSGDEPIVVKFDIPLPLPEVSSPPGSGGDVRPDDEAGTHFQVVESDHDGDVGSGGGRNDLDLTVEEVPSNVHLGSVRAVAENALDGVPVTTEWVAYHIECVAIPTVDSPTNDLADP